MRLVLSSALDDEVLLGRTLREHAELVPVPEGAWVVLDPCCPLVPPEFVTELVRQVAATGRPHVGVRRVTDTVKELVDGTVGSTVDRESLYVLAAPLVLPTAPPEGGSMSELVEALEDVVLLEAPPAARRVSDVSEIRLLEALALITPPTGAEASPRPARPPGT